MKSATIAADQINHCPNLPHVETMSSQYNIEPLPTGRVLIQTSMGPLDIELFAKETPKTCRSFIQLCLEGYYNGVIFHRIVKDFIVQTGDPTGTGTGGEAATPEGVVRDEFHSRLRYTRRGLVGMANSGEKDDNGSQFFITLSAAPELERKNTLFGRIAVGDTIFNALRIGSLETDQLDRPLHPPKVLHTKVVENPFTDIVPRSTEEERQERQRKLEQEKARLTIKKAKKRNRALLSFGDDEPDDGVDTIKTKRKSLYDLEDPAVREPGPPPPRPPTQHQEPTPQAQGKRQPPTETVDPAAPSAAAPSTTSFAAPVPIIVNDNPSAAIHPKKQAAPQESVEDQISALKSQLKRLKHKRAATSDDDENTPTSSKPGKKFIESEIARYMSGGRAILGKRSRKTRREEDTLSRLTQFRKNVAGASDGSASTPAPVERMEPEACALHNVPGCMSCFDRFGEQPDDDDPKSLWGHKLVFARDLFGKDEKYRAQRQGEDLEVIDPRERAKDFAEQDKRGRRDFKSAKVWRQEESGHRQAR